MRILYSLLLYLAVPLILARLYWRGHRAPDYRHRWAERFALFPPLPAAGCIGVHAVSVGEARAAAPLVQALQRTFPNVTILVTTTTPTGSHQVRQTMGEDVRHVYAPYDLPDTVARFLARTRPRLAIIMETEIWPNVFHQCANAGIPLIVANARLSQRSVGSYARVGGFTRESLENATLIDAQ
jgi:3-deoxy-D-manno-octulosonic-acid transferase